MKLKLSLYIILSCLFDYAEYHRISKLYHIQIIWFSRIARALWDVHQMIYVFSRMSILYASLQWYFASDVLNYEYVEWVYQNAPLQL